MRTLAVVILALGACDNRFEARVGGALLPQAFATTARPAGTTTVAILPGVAPTLPAGPLALAIDVNVPWVEVAALVRATPPPVLLVGDFDRLRAFPFEDQLDDGPALRLTATAGGKFCVRPPGAELAYCLESADRRHISAAFVREVMRKAVAEYGLTQARLDVDPAILWADLVRTIDGTRACCKVPVKVALRR